MPLTLAQALSLHERLRPGSDTARLDCELLLAHVLGVARSYLFAWPERELTAAQARDFLTLLARREQGEPVAYLLGWREFWSLRIGVSAASLIPRPDTETLVELALQLLPADQPQAVADLGTGTGAIALAMAHERPLWQVLALDKDLAALELARANRLTLGLTNLEIIHSDWFAELEGQRFDLILSNPPYLAADDPHLCQGDLRFEPRDALVAEAQGLADLTLLIRQAPQYLRAGGWLALEHGFAQGQAVRDLMLAQGFSMVRSVQDLSGHERATCGRLTNSEAG